MSEGHSAPATADTRPPPEPPYVRTTAAVRSGHDQTPISSLTPLDYRAWDVWLSYSYGGEFPALGHAILDGIQHGVPLDFIGDRTTSRSGRNHNIDAPLTAKVAAVIAADVAKLKKAGPFDERPYPIFSASPIGAVAKKDSDKVRVIHDLSHPFGGDSVNAGIREVRVRISSFGHAARAVIRLGRGCFLVKIDIEAAYKLVPVHPDDWFLLGFTWDGKYYYERVLPFGLRSSSRLWDLYAAALRHFIAVDLDLPFERIVIHYVDDFLFVVKIESDAALLLDRAESLCAELGVPLSHHKTTGPTTCLTFLGIELDTIAMEARLPAEKLTDLNRLLSEWRGKSRASVEEAQSLHGLLQFACTVVRPGRYFRKRISAWAADCDAQHASRRATYVIPAGVHADIDWWRHWAATWNGTSLLYEIEWESSDKLELWTDACMTGYGAYHKGAWMAGTWSPTQLAIAHHQRKRVSMPFLELHALVYAAKAWGHEWRQKKILFHCDCMPVVNAIRRASSRRPAMMHLLRELIESALHHGFDFACVHIEGASNTVADVLSRHGDCADFRALCPQAEQQLTPAPHILLPHPSQC